MLKFKKYRVRRFGPSPVQVPARQKPGCQPKLKKNLYCYNISQEMIYFNYLLPIFKLPKESATLLFSGEKIL
jgi:hypothetical protein